MAKVKRELKIPVPLAALRTSYFSKSSSGTSDGGGVDGRLLLLPDVLDFLTDLVLRVGESGKAG